MITLKASVEPSLDVKFNFFIHFNDTELRSLLFRSLVSRDSNRSTSVLEAVPSGKSRES